jgi:hypothetical protein
MLCVCERRFYYADKQIRSTAGIIDINFVLIRENYQEAIKEWQATGGNTFVQWKVDIIFDIMQIITNLPMLRWDKFAHDMYISDNNKIRKSLCCLAGRSVLV